MRLVKSKTVIVTGASRGIGRAAALALARFGANVVLCARSGDALAEVAEECRSFGVRAVAEAGNVASARTVTRLARAAFDLGDVYGFVHAAGALHPGPALWELSERRFNDVVGASLTGAFQLVRHVVPRLRESGGAAVFFGSGAAEMTLPGLAAYCAAKAAEECLARQLAAEAPEIVSFVYRPGVVETFMQEQARNAKGAMAERVRADFRGMRDRGELLRPEQAAEGLLRALVEGPERFAGRVARLAELLPGDRDEAAGQAMKEALQDRFQEGQGGIRTGIADPCPRPVRSARRRRAPLRTRTRTMKS